MPTKTLFYCVHVAAHHSRHDKSGSLKWSRAYDTVKEAAVERDRVLAAGEATLAFVVRFEGGQRTIMETYTRPASAGKIIRHYLDLDEALAEAEGKDQ